MFIVLTGFPRYTAIMRHGNYDRASLLPPGEGQDEGINKIKALAFRSPHPNPLPEGEGIKWDSSAPDPFVH
jgi:hypothetical protein